MKNNLPDFLCSRSIQKLFELLGKDNLRVVGGAIRNHLLGVTVTDIDCATVLTPDQVMDICKSAGVKAIPTGIDYGTVTIVIDGQSFEVTTLRRDVETDGRRAVVAYTNSWEEDARRRDFTMNALYMDCDGQVYDPLGQGRDDLKKRLVRFIGVAENRIKEDALRVLRFYRFSLYYGEGLDQESAQACAAHAGLLTNLSRERITDELLKICNYRGDPDKFVDSVRSMSNGKIFSVLKTPSLNFEKIRKLIKLQKRYELNSVLSILYLLFSFDASHLQKTLCLSKKQKTFLERLDEATSKSDLPVKHLLYYYGRDIGQQALLFRNDYQEADITDSKTWNIPVFPVIGQDLLDHGMMAGPEIGEKLKEIEQWWVDQGFKPDKDECLVRWF